MTTTDRAIAATKKALGYFTYLPRTQKVFDALVGFFKEAIDEATADRDQLMNKLVWADMETAPRDGTEVILQVKLRAGIPGKMLVGHYQRGGHCIEDHPPIDAGWYFWNGRMFGLAEKPVCWMALPVEK